MVKTHLVRPGDQRAARNLSAVARLIFGDAVVHLDLDQVKLDRGSKRAMEAFKHTPEPLIEAWVTHRKLLEATRPGDTVLISDWRGLGGVFALAQWSLPPGERRTVVTVAGDSAALQWLDVAGTIADLPTPLASQLDWEIAQYEWSHEVVAVSEYVFDLLGDLVVRGDLEIPAGRPSAAVSDPSVVWAPEPVGRRSRTGDILRALTSLSGARLVVSESDEEDEVWSGTSWDALRHSRAVLGDRVERAANVAQPTLIVLGDPFSVPDEEVETMVDRGIPVVVPARSAAAARWPTAPTWTTTDELVDALNGGPAATSTPAHRRPRRRVEAPERGRRISVGVPVFRDVRFLEECLDSILGQDLEPTEVIIVDDGSGSEEVDDALESARSKDGRIRILRGEHRGVCVARNRALEEMTGDSFLFVDSDDVLEPAFLGRCAEMLRSDDRLMAVATWTRFFGAYEGIEAKPPFDARVGSRENPIISTAALVDMSARELGVRFQPELAFLYCEDWHFWSQIIAAGGRMGLVPEALIRHRVHQRSGGFMRTDLAYAIGKARSVALLEGLSVPGVWK